MASNESGIVGFGDQLVNNTRDMDVVPITTNKAKEDNEANLIVVIERDEVKLETSTNSDEEIKKCAYCERPGPVYKCVKNHSKCNGLLFCDRKCNKSAHRQEKYKAFMASAANFLTIIGVAFAIGAIFTPIPVFI